MRQKQRYYVTKHGHVACVLELFWVNEMRTNMYSKWVTGTKSFLFSELFLISSELPLTEHFNGEEISSPRDQVNS